MLDMGEPIKVLDIARRLIRFRGLRVGEDIAIAFVGLRPGDKLTEELATEFEVTRPTSNPSVLAVESGAWPALSDVSQMVDVLAELARKGDQAVLRASLGAMALDDAAAVASQELNKVS
jgi:O-antigen biosynthesis protein WbqV